MRAFEGEETRVNDIDRTIYDVKDKVDAVFTVDSGLTPEIVNQVSVKKKDLGWMRLFRQKSLRIYNEMPLPGWGPFLDGLDMDYIVTYVRPRTSMSSRWEQVPENIKNTLERLGTPQAERLSLAGVGVQYDSEIAYHNVHAKIEAQGVVYAGIESALHGPYAEMIRKRFMKLVPPSDHEFAALRGAVWPGDSFVYVPEGVKLTIPLQSYSRLNAPGVGQFEHTLIIVEKNAYLHFIEGCSTPRYNVANLHTGCVELFIDENAHLRYSIIENWSKNMYNLNTKRALVEKGDAIEWVSGSFGSDTSCLYPMSVLKDEGARAEFTGTTFTGKGQTLDNGSKVIHATPNTSSRISTKSISKDGGTCIHRNSVVITPEATHSKSLVLCESLMLGSESRSDTIPVMDIQNDESDMGHEAKIGRISDTAILYLMTHGLSEDGARSIIVSGFAEPIAKELPMGYAVEMNNLIELKMSGSIG